MNVINWDEFFMGTALLAGYRSKDPSTKVGCCIILDKKIVGVGYNGMPYGCNDDCYPWSKSGDELCSKYLYVVHAELNAILNSTVPLKDAILYTSLFPCNECCKAIIQSGIKEIVYLSDKYSETNSIKAAKRMLNSANVVTRAFNSTIETLCISFNATNV